MPDFMVELGALTAQSPKMLRAACSPAPAPAKSSRCTRVPDRLEEGPLGDTRQPAVGRYPQTDTVIAILREIKPEGWHDQYVFRGLKAGSTCSNNTMLKLLKVDMERNATVRGFRSSFRTGGQNETTIAGDVMEHHHIEGEEANSPCAVRNERPP
jgi:hypothetical protein